MEERFDLSKELYEDAPKNGNYDLLLPPHLSAKLVENSQRKYCNGFRSISTNRTAESFQLRKVLISLLLVVIVRTSYLEVRSNVIHAIM